jgi:hypothetical protein
MKCFALACAVVAALGSWSWAAEGLNQQTLREMGLGDLAIMSDNEGLAVRGFGYSPVKAYGKSWASVSAKGASAGAENAYSSTGKHKAWGETNSKAGVIITIGGGHGGHGGHGGGNNESYGGGGGHKGGGSTKAIIAFSGGSSSAGRK